MYKFQFPKYPLIVLAGMLLFFYLLNYLMPMAFGDDYLYAFVWQGKPMYVPLTENAIKVNTWYDLAISQLSFYFTWSGRIVNNTLAQLFAWSGKNTFNICNALVCTLLVMEIYWCIHKGNVSLTFKPDMLCWIFFVFWAFTPRFPSVVLWLVGAFHYLWPAFFLLAFLLPYVHKYYFSQDMFVSNYKFSLGMLFLGLIAGCTNENSVCWIIFILVIYLFYINKKEPGTQIWMFAGLVGLIIGYAFLMLSPGNYARLISVHGHDWFNRERLFRNLFSFVQVLVWQFILWFFCLHSLSTLQRAINAGVKINEKKYEYLAKDVSLVKALCIVGIGMSVIMLFSPEFHLRSAFPGTVQLIIATGIVVRTQQEYGIELISKQVKRFLICVSIIFFVVTSGVTIHYLNEHRLWTDNILTSVELMHEKERDKQIVLCVDSFQKPSRLENFLSGFHTFENNMSDNENDWRNVAFARYYGIKGIRVIHPEEAVSEKQ